MKHGTAFLLLMLLVVTAVSAQQVTGSSGRSLSTSSGGLSYTLGEPVIKTHERGSITLSQGFHQPVTTVKKTQDNDESEAQSGQALAGQLSIRAWPNPANDFLNVETRGIEEALVFEVMDTRGMVLLRTAPEFTNGVFRIPLEGIAAQTLFVEVRTASNRRLEIIKIFKTKN